MKIPHDLSDRVVVGALSRNHQATWSHTCESSFLLTLEAYRRFLDLTQDPRQATGLTLAWASLEGGERSYPG